jgi:hypothetical protein
MPFAAKIDDGIDAELLKLADSLWLGLGASVQIVIDFTEV